MGAVIHSGFGPAFTGGFSRRGARFSKLARDYFALVEAGGGTVLDKPFTNALIVELQTLGIYDDCRCLVGARLGNTVRIDGLGDAFSSKAFDASPLKGHYVQTSEGSQPKLVGNQWDFATDRHMLGDATARTALRNVPGLCAIAAMRGCDASDVFYNYWYAGRFNGAIRFGGRSNGNVRPSSTKSTTVTTSSIDTNTSLNQDAIISVNTIGNVAHAYVNLSESLGTPIDLGAGNYPDIVADEAVLGALRVSIGFELGYNRLGRMIMLFGRELTNSERQGIVAFLMEAYGIS